MNDVGFEFADLSELEDIMSFISRHWAVNHIYSVSKELLIKATLVWTDPPSALITDQLLVNNLDLQLYISNTNETLLGNNYGSWQYKKKADNINNVEKIETILKFDNIISVVSKNIDIAKKDNFLDFLTIESNLLPDKSYEIKLIFSGDSIIKINAEVIDVTLDDQGMPWESKTTPKHEF